MNIRSLQTNDINELKRIHELYFREEFEFPDFLNGYYCVFVVTDDSNSIITAGGVRPIAESVIITNQDYSVRKRMDALNKLLDASRFTCNQSGYNQLHAFIQNKTWLTQLYDKGFRPTKGESIVIDV